MSIFISQIIWMVWLAAALGLVVATLVTTMSNRTKEAFYSVTLLVLAGFSVPVLHTLGMVDLPFTTFDVANTPVVSLVNIVFAVPQIFAVLLLMSLYVTLHCLGYTQGISTSFFIFVKPFYASQFLEIRVDDMHIREGTRGNNFKNPVALALSDVVTDHGYRPLYVFAGSDLCKIVTNEATMVLEPSKRSRMFMAGYTKYRPVKAFNSTLKVMEIKLDPSATRLGFLGFGLIRGLL